MALEKMLKNIAEKNIRLAKRMIRGLNVITIANFLKGSYAHITKILTQ